MATFWSRQWGPLYPNIAQSLNNLGYLSCVSGVSLRKAALDLAEASGHARLLRRRNGKIRPAVAQRAALLRDGMRLRVEVSGRHPGLLSGVVFAGVNRADRRPEETILTALEASELELGNVELVVLSACKTRRGQVAGGEGVLGLQRASQLSGAGSVVASLWSVPDEETHQLMREFYRRVWSDKPLSKAEALRQAQLWMLENWKPRDSLERPALPKGPPSPYYWAAFVLSGD